MPTTAAAGRVRVCSAAHWLTSFDARHDSGHALSWAGPARPGYAYPEVSGYVLAFLARTGRAADRRRELVSALLTEAETGVSRGDRLYTFDTGMALAGLVSELRHGRASAPVAARADRWVSEVCAAIGAGHAVTGQRPTEPSSRWSEVFGCSQGKLALALAHCRGRGDPVQLEVALDALLEQALALQDSGGRFRIHAQSSLTYLHAHCYALEGLVGQLMRTLPAARAAVALRALTAGTDWLALVQDASGGLRAWHDGSRASGPVRCDVTAQAVRLWLLVDPAGYAVQISSAAAFVRRHQHCSGAIPYEPGSPDLNTWATVFWAQAETWQESGPVAAQLV